MRMAIRDLSGQHVLIFGGSSGIGLATAQQVRALGGEVTITGRSEERLKQAQQTLGGGRICVGDLTREADVIRGFDTAGSVDHVVLAGGTHLFGKVWTLSQDDLDRLMGERIWGPIYIVRQVAKRMKRGSITLMSGGLGSRPAPGAAIKHAVLCATEGLARGLALEMAPIRVNAIAPGHTRTPLFDGLLGENLDARLAEISENLPLGRVGTADEVADAIITLITNGFINGEVMHTDGAGRFAPPRMKFT